MTLPGLFIKMLRPRVAYILLIFAALGVVQGGETRQWAWQYPLVALIIAAWYVNATTINDIADYEIDQINLKGVADRPLANRRVLREQIIELNRFAAALALVAGFGLNLKIGVLVAICLALSYVYSMPPVRISYRGAVAPLLLPIGYIVLPYLVGAWSINETITSHGWLILTALYISFIGRIILKDFRDVKGDAKFGKRTFLLRYGRLATCIVSAVCLTIGTTILLWILPHQPIILAVFIAILVCVLYGLWVLYNNPVHQLEQLTIGAVVRVASGAVVVLLAVVTLQNKHQTVTQQWLVAASLGLLFMGMFWEVMNRAVKLGAVT